MGEISIRKYQQESGERPFQFTEIEGSNCRVPPLPPPSFPNSSQKMSCFLSQRLSHHLHCLLRGSLWTVLGHMVLHMTAKLAFWVAEALQLHTSQEKREEQVKKDLSLLLGTVPKACKEKQLLGVCADFVVWISSFCTARIGTKI